MDKQKTGKFVTEADAAKNEPIHAGSSGLKEALFRYSDKNMRKHLYKKDDVMYATQYLDKNLMDIFNYHHIPLQDIDVDIDTTQVQKEKYHMVHITY